jgi:signal transduction histidine kinase
LNAVVRWAAAGCAVQNLTSQIQDCARRISKLVTAVKGFTHMDQANVADTVDVGSSLVCTVAVLTSKAQEKSVAVTLDQEAELPKVRGFAGELNQVWGNLIDNALDAVAKGGRVEVLATREGRAWWCGFAMTGLGFRQRFTIGFSIRSLRPSRWDRERVSGWILHGGWCGITTALSILNRSGGGRSFE